MRHAEAAASEPASRVRVDVRQPRSDHRAGHEVMFSYTRSAQKMTPLARDTNGNTTRGSFNPPSYGDLIQEAVVGPPAPPSPDGCAPAPPS